LKGQIILATAGAASNRTANNVVEYNSIVTSATVPGIFVDALTAQQPNTIDNNSVRVH
jgi:hypothetical protein